MTQLTLTESSPASTSGSGTLEVAGDVVDLEGLTWVEVEEVDLVVQWVVDLAEVEEWTAQDGLEDPTDLEVAEGTPLEEVDSTEVNQAGLERSMTVNLAAAAEEVSAAIDLVKAVADTADPDLEAGPQAGLAAGTEVASEAGLEETAVSLVVPMADIRVGVDAMVAEDSLAEEMEDFLEGVTEDIAEVVTEDILEVETEDIPEVETWAFLEVGVMEVRTLVKVVDQLILLR